MYTNAKKSCSKQITAVDRSILIIIVQVYFILDLIST